MKSSQTKKLQHLDNAHHLHPFTDTKALGVQGSRIIEKTDSKPHLFVIVNKVEAW